MATTALAADTNLAAERSAQALAASAASAASGASGAAPTPVETLPILDLLVRGGWLMVPIGMMSVVVVALGVERTLGLRRAWILPATIARSVEEMQQRGSFRPQALRELCRQFPSSVARVAEAALLKLGRPVSELERTVSEACQREADQLYTNVRTLNLASTITPLLGLLGTVWGMIQAFFATANMPIGSNKGQALAEGIYVALVTTFTGLSIAIPAAILAHVFESRILRLLREVEQLLGGLLPQLEHYEVQLRIDDPHDEPRPMKAPRPAVRRDAKAS
jgi:biopolymer transport protein ExbB